MEAASFDFSEVYVEILPPDTANVEGQLVVCLCCSKLQPTSWMDDDGCGICEKCLAS